MAALDIPILQGLCLTSSREEWAASDDGVTPLDSATQIAIPEFDGRIITVPFSFKEIDEDGLPHYVADPERCARVAGIAVAHAACATCRPAERKIALMLSAYPTKHSRIGNAVGLDTPVSAIRLLRRMREAGYDLGGPGEIPGLDARRRHQGRQRADPRPDRGRRPGRGVADHRAAQRRARADPGRGLPRWMADLPAGLIDAVTEAWGESPGKLFVNDERRDRAGHPRGRQRRAADPAAARVRREPGRDLPRPRPGALAPLSRGLPVARGGIRRARGRAPRQARLDGVVARQERRDVGVLRDRRRASGTCR